MNENDILSKLSQKYGLPPLQHKASTEYKPIFFFYGAKGVGKTTAALSTYGTIDCISYDGMSMDIKMQLIKNNKENNDRIKVFDIGVIELLNEDEITNSEAVLEHGVRGYDYTKAIISESTADWIIFDGVDYLVNYAEMKMRKENNILPYEGFKNLNYWKYRTQLLRSILTLAAQKANCGVILVGWEEISQYDEEGKTKNVKAPRWTDIFKTASSIVVHISQYNIPSKQQHLHYAFIDSSKNEDLFKTAERIDISDRKSLINIEKYNYLLQRNNKKPIIKKDDNVDNLIDNSENDNSENDNSIDDNPIDHDGWDF